MSPIARILLNHLCFELPCGRVIWHDLTHTFPHKKIGLVGRNGIGKSTLLKLMVGELIPSSGSIDCHGSLAYVPQLVAFTQSMTLAELLGVGDKYSAWLRIKRGSIAEDDYEILNEEWDLPIRISEQLALFNLTYLDPNRLVQSLSGGELTRLLLTRALYSKADYILLDEPTNHLDANARAQLYDAIDNWKGGLIVVSHDRTLLNKMDEIVELSQLGVHTYGGNYDDYLAQKTLETDAATQLIAARKAEQQKARRTIQLRRERHEQNEARGKEAKRAQIQAKGCYDKIEMKSALGRSERTNRRIRMQADRKTESVDEKLHQAKNKIEIVEAIRVSMPHTYVPNGKLMLEVDKLNYQYPNNSAKIIENLSFQIWGSAHVALMGDNGSGKTTLINLILKKMTPDTGSIHLGTDRVGYLDQHASMLDPACTVLQNFLKFNPTTNETEARFALAQFLFRNEAALQLVQALSGGEKLRALLACTLMSSRAPQLLILDEPTNHLDLPSIRSIESALKNYQGAMIIISHDIVFLKNIGVDQILQAPF